MRYSTLTTPIGELMLTADDDGALTAVHLPNRHPDPGGWERDDELLAAPAASSPSTSRASGRRSTCRCGPPARPFQLRVWEALLRIPYGETASYGEIARELGHADGRLAARSAPPTAATRSRSSCPATA